jgi:hypothetical protein
VAHWVDAAHGVPPPSFGTQTPPEQNSVAAQPASLVQPFAQSVPAQVFGLQS